jgi:hypothetical protein
LQASLVSAKLVFALLIALFSSGNPPPDDGGVLVDRLAGGAITGTYVATAEQGDVALVRVEPQGAPEVVAILERVDGASHLFTELENERVYSLEPFFREEYTLAEGMTTTMELPVYPEAMIQRASAEENTSPESPTTTWRFVRSGALLYLFPGDREEILVVRASP